eukprot:1262722-Rhodomonas_salina.1
MDVFFMGFTADPDILWETMYSRRLPIFVITILPSTRFGALFVLWMQIQGRSDGMMHNSDHQWESSLLGCRCSAVTDSIFPVT